MELWEALLATAFLAGIPALVLIAAGGVCIAEGIGAPAQARRIITAGYAGVIATLGLLLAMIWVQVGT